MILDRLSIFSEVLTQILEPGEKALVLAAAMYRAGNENLGAPRPGFDGDTVLDMALGLPTPYLMAVADGLVTGTSLWGWPGCLAQQLAEVLGSVPDLVLTDRRLLLVKIAEGTARQLWQCPRAAILAARRAPRLFQAGRVILTFADGSALAVMLGVVSGSNARRVVSALQPIAGELA